LEINNIEQIITAFKSLNSQKIKVKRKNDKLNANGARYEKIIERIMSDPKFAFVWNGNICPQGQGIRNEYKSHFVGVCKGYGMTQEEIEPYIVKCFGNCDGENSIDSLF
jgi:hypothetical protein